MFRRTDLPVYKEQPGGNGAAFPEVMNALTGVPSKVVRVSEQGEQIVSVAVPIQRYRAVIGVLMLSTQGGDIDKIVAEERRAILRVFGVAALVTVVLSMLLASTIANPLRRLSAAAVRVRRGVKKREEIPDFSDRQDEIGNLSVALREMTNALYARIEAIESFAADVSHELKNPLTSLRSAVETLPLAKNEASRSTADGSHPARRAPAGSPDHRHFRCVAARRRTRARGRRTRGHEEISCSTSLQCPAKPESTRSLSRSISRSKSCRTGQRSYTVLGHDLRLGQVITNLIENARSFVPGRYRPHRDQPLARRQSVVVTVDDNGPGIRADNIDRIFERFYTDRPAGEAFGQNSGLGLSISRQIVEAHGGTLTAENIPGGKPGDIRGARFVVTLPAEA